MSTTINTIPGIKVNGSNEIFGGFIYKASFNLANTNSPGTATVEVVNASGDYNIPRLDGKQTFNFRIGSFSWKAYLLSYTLDESSSGNILKLQFIDESWKLDKYYVGLYKRHGLARSGAMLIVGEEQFPCGNKAKGKVDSSLKDKCYPEGNAGKYSRTGTDSEYAIDCEVLAKTNVLDVNYNFRELLQKMPISFSGRYRDNDDYRDRFTGTLREVLGQWGNVFGFSFVFANGRINFIDLNSGIPFVDSPPGVNKIDSISTTQTLESTYSQGVVTYFAKNGEIRDYQENRDDNPNSGNPWIKKIACNYIDLEQIFGKTFDYYSTSYREAIPINTFKISCILAHYGELFRDYFWYKFAFDRGAFDGNPKGEGFRVTALGGMEVLQAYQKDGKGKEVFDSLYGSLSSELKNLVDSSGEPFFFVAEYDQDIHAQQGEYDFRISELLGRYFFSYYSEPFVGNDGERLRANILAPGDANIIYAQSGDTVSNIDLFNYGPPVNTFVSSLLQLQEDGDTLRAVKGFILVDRNSRRFAPREASRSEGDSRLIPALKSQMFYLVENLENSTIKSSWGESNPNYKIFIGLKPIVKIEAKIGNHPTETKNNRTVQGNVNYTYGLSSNSCITVSFRGNNAQVDFHSPSPESAQGSNNNAPYNVLLEKQPPNWKGRGPRLAYSASPDSVGDGGIDANGNLVIPKLEVTRSSVPSVEDGTFAVQVIERDVSTDEIPDYFDQDNDCKWSESEIKQFHQKFQNNVGTGAKTPFVKKTYRCFGLVNNLPTIEQGLINASFSVDDSGVYTEYTIGNTAAERPRFEATKDFLLNKNDLRQKHAISSMPVRALGYGDIRPIPVR